MTGAFTIVACNESPDRSDPFTATEPTMNIASSTPPKRSTLVSDSPLCIIADDNLLHAGHRGTLTVVGGAALPFDLSSKRVERVRKERANDRALPPVADPELTVVTQRAGRNVRVTCPLANEITKDEMQRIVNQANADGRWAKLDRILAKRSQLQGRLSTTSHRTSSSAGPLHFGEVTSNMDCGGGGDLRGSTGALRRDTRTTTGLSNVEGCGDPQVLTTITVVAKINTIFLSHDAIICFVLGKCVRDWGISDAWYGKEEIWVDEGLGEWGVGPEPPVPTPAEENAEICTVYDDEASGLAAEMGTSNAAETDPFLMLDAAFIIWDIVDWANEGYSCAGLANVMAGVGMAMVPGPNVAAMVQRGARNSKIAAALRRGREAHADFARDRAALGDLTEVLIEGVRTADGRIVRGRIDAVEINESAREIVLRELKPSGTRQNTAGETQLLRYVNALVSDGRTVNRMWNGAPLDFKSLTEAGYSIRTQVIPYTP